MEDEDIALNSVLGLELNRVFFAVRETANKQKIIEFAREVLQSERTGTGAESALAGRTGELERGCGKCAIQQIARRRRQFYLNVYFSRNHFFFFFLFHFFFFLFFLFFFLLFILKKKIYRRPRNGKQAEDHRVRARGAAKRAHQAGRERLAGRTGELARSCGSRRRYNRSCASLAALTAG